jgi:hypothetical protein
VTSELRPVPDFDDLLASDEGHLFLKQDDGALHRVEPCRRKDGYLLANLKKDGRWLPYSVHRLVASAWYGKPDGPRTVTRHLDGNRANNVPSNLRFGSVADNVADAVQAGRLRKGSAHPNSRLTEADVESIRHAIAMNVTYQTIGDHWGVTKSTVCDIARGRTWRSEPTAAVAAVSP